ncbi:protein tramtrack, beta isoform-like isoform X7 [Penaeus chinensis]|uniref:protein tramtrack, beta isoform-like isoform X7 n=1 Tax=Penaeus chinensis TaxID=139456 RepID=UPI001FB7A0E9|nr:protein tramtrack, beta isoform-like isoform X7 [Penaeus chinensis]
MEELLSLKWNNHRSTFLHILGVLRDKQSYTDVTLACDGKFYSVHKLVLSTCSDYFCAMFEKTACKSPVIVLKDIKCEDLEALLDYMYLGEVNVRQSDLASLIKAAENLRIKGLAVPDDEPPKRVTAPPTRTDSSRREGGSGSPPSKRKRRDEGEDGREDVRPQVSGLHTPPPPSRPKSPNTQRQSPSSHRTPQEQHIAEDHDSRPLSSPAESPAATHTSGHQPSHQPSQSQQLPHQSSHQVSLQPSQQLGEQPTQQPVSNQYRGDESQTFVKVEMEETDDTGDMNQDSYNMSGDGYKEEDSGGDLGGDLSNDLPEFLQQAASGALAGTSASYPHTFAGPSGFQPEVSGWQGDGQSLPGSFGGLGFPPHSSQDNQPGGPGDWNAYGSWDVGVVGKQRGAQPHHGRITSTSGGLSDPLAVTSTGSRQQINTARPTKTTDKVFGCPTCGKTFNNAKDCRRHAVIHTGIKPFKCPYCPHRANLKFNLTKHIQAKHKLMQHVTLG